MRRYIIALLLMALVIGSLFKAADQTGVRLMKMFATLGIFLFGVVGTMALSRWQSRTGLKETETALKALEPDFLITDWAYQGKGRPDYVLVGSGGVVAVCLDDTPQSTRVKSAANKVAAARGKAQQSARWLQEHLSETAGDLVQGTPVETVLVLTRRRALAEYTADGVTVLNAEQLTDHMRSLWGQTLLDQPARVKLTRLLRSA